MGRVAGRGLTDFLFQWEWNELNQSKTKHWKENQLARGPSIYDSRGQVCEKAGRMRIDDDGCLWFTIRLSPVSIGWKPLIKFLIYKIFKSNGWK